MTRGDEGVAKPPLPVGPGAVQKNIQKEWQDAWERPYGSARDEAAVDGDTDWDRRPVGPSAAPKALTALGAGPRPGQVPSTAAAMTESARALQKTAGNAAMATMLRRGGGALPVQRMTGRGSTRVYGRGGPLDGLDARGNFYRFDHRDVRANGLRDADGNMIGISFPTRPEDIARVTAWAAAPNRTSDVEVYTVTMSGDVRRRELTAEAVSPAPWSSRPIYIHAHATNAFFDIPVDTGDAVRVLRVDGTVFGMILRRHPGFQEAVRNTPGRDGLLMSCSSGHPDATAAAEMAQFMHRAGSTRTWHAPVGNGVRMRPGATTSAYGSTQSWDLHGNEVPAGFVSFPPPPEATQASQSYAQAPGDPYSYSQYGQYGQGYS